MTDGHWHTPDCVGHTIISQSKKALAHAEDKFDDE